jgi:hypothetical protein
MSDEEYGKSWLTWQVAAVTVLVLVVAVAGLYILLAPPEGPPPDDRTLELGDGDDPLEMARAKLARDHDATTCLSALRQVNNHLAKTPADALPPVDAAYAERVRKLFGFDDGETAEIETRKFTPLDAQHLDLCLLMGDVARSLEVRGFTGPDGKDLGRTPLGLAEAAFEWVVREVRLQGDQKELYAPPHWVLRRGWGTPLDRALIFLELLRQMGQAEKEPADLLGCLLFVPDGGDWRFWACGVVIKGGDDLYLFDPRLGLPLPGLAGKGIATLAAVGKDPALLRQLDSGKGHAYDVTAEQARSARVFLAVSLSALAPRLGKLERLLPNSLRVRVTAEVVRPGSGEDGELLTRLRKAAPEVRVYKKAAGLLRDFLPAEDGGTDKTYKKQIFVANLVPREFLPTVVADQSAFSSDSPMGRRLMALFATPFLRSALEPGGARDLMLRGRRQKAVGDLSEELPRWEPARRGQAEKKQLALAANEWAQKAIAAYASRVRARTPREIMEADRAVEQVWELKEARAILVLMRDAIAIPRRAEVSYLSALCKHEDAVLMQARLDLLREAGGKADAYLLEDVKKSWEGAAFLWREHIEGTPSELPSHAAARRMRGEALARLGDAEEARSLWEDLSGTMTPLEKVALLYRARRLKAPKK